VRASSQAALRAAPRPSCWSSTTRPSASSSRRCSPAPATPCSRRRPSRPPSSRPSSTRRAGPRHGATLGPRTRRVGGRDPWSGQCGSRLSSAGLSRRRSHGVLELPTALPPRRLGRPGRRHPLRGRTPGGQKMRLPAARPRHDRRHGPAPAGGWADALARLERAELEKLRRSFPDTPTRTCCVPSRRSELEGGDRVGVGYRRPDRQQRQPGLGPSAVRGRRHGQPHRLPRRPTAPGGAPGWRQAWIILDTCSFRGRRTRCSSCAAWSTLLPPRAGPQARPAGVGFPG